MTWASKLGSPVATATTSEKTKTKKKPQETPKKPESLQEMRHSRQQRFGGAKTPKDTQYWVAQRLHEEQTNRAIGILQSWIHPS